MSGNRKKKLRRITVDGKTYRWIVSDHCCGSQTAKLKIWDDKSVIHESERENVRCPHCEDGEQAAAITPSKVSDIIRTETEKGKS